MDNELRPRTRGQSIVEAALALPVLIMLMLGMLDFGRAYYAIVSLKDAADEGASYASYDPADVTGIRLRASEASRQLAPIEPNDVAVIYPPTLYAGAPITVTTKLTLRLYTPFANTFVPSGELELHGTATHALVSTH
ncbi:MAG: pilus assembly protein [Phycisphaerae bacterium]|nr:pilus assembly protein [Phycisphaerae bacterium]